MARIELVRSGGFAGLSLRRAVDTAAEPDADWYAEQLAALDLAHLAAQGPGEPAPDRYQYVVQVEGDDGSSHRLEFAETAMPEQLRPLVERLESRPRS